MVQISEAVEKVGFVPVILEAEALCPQQEVSFAVNVKVWFLPCVSVSDLNWGSAVGERGVVGSAQLELQWSQLKSIRLSCRAEPS